MSYQIDIPVKAPREPQVQRNISSSFLKPIGAPKTMSSTEIAGADQEAASSTETQSQNEASQGSVWKKEPAAWTEIEAESSNDAFQEEKENSFSDTSSTVLDESLGLNREVSREPVKEAQLVVPRSAILNETISISYASAPNVRPVVDIYDSNRKLFIRSQPMEDSGTPGNYKLLLPIRGISFIPGRSIRVAVIEKATGLFKSSEIMIETSPSAMGWEKEVGGTSVLELLGRLERLIQEIRIGTDIPTVLNSLETNLADLAGILSEASLNADVLEKLNRAAEELADLASRKGYDAHYLVEQPLRPGDGLDKVSDKMRDFRSAISMLQTLYSYHAGAGTAE